MKHIFKLTSDCFIIGALSLFLTTCSSPSTGNSTFEPSLGDSVVSTMPPYTFNAGDSNGASWDASVSSLPIEMDSIVFDHKLYMDCKSCSHPLAHYSIPKLKTSDSEYAAVVEGINGDILKFIEYEEDEEYGRSIWTINVCAGVDFNYEFYANLLYISVHMVRHCAHGDCDDFFFKLFDLTTGGEIEQKEILFSDLFSTKGYFDFLNKIGWTEQVKKAYEDGYKSAFEEDPDYIEKFSEEIELQALRAQFHIDFELIHDEIKISMDGEGTMSYAQRCYDPYHYERFKIADLKPYLGEVGKKFLFERDTSKSIIESQLWLNELYNQIEDYLFLGVFIEEKPYKMALNYQNPDKVWGYLYDEKGNCEEIEGFLSFGIFVLNSERRGEIIVECAQLENHDSPNYYGYARKYRGQ
ncbi:MAG: hypothetical protein IK005_01505 [Paludibacteraceae bacterium]|nr:hypothetical protein [Paludibacteraceae bacterium]